MDSKWFWRTFGNTNQTLFSVFTAAMLTMSRTCHIPAGMSPPHPALDKQPGQPHLARDPWQMSLRGDSFSWRNCSKCLFVSKCCKIPALLCHITPSTDKAQSRRRGTTQQRSPLVNEDKINKITGQKLQKQGVSRGAGKRAPHILPWPNPCRDAAPCWALTAPQRGKETSWDDLKLLSWPYF